MTTLWLSPDLNSAAAGSLPCPHPGPSRHPATPVVLFPWENGLKDSKNPSRLPSLLRAPARQEPVGDKGPHSPGVGVGGTWGQGSSLRQLLTFLGAWPSGPIAFVPIPVTDSCRASLLGWGQIGAVNFDPVTRGWLYLGRSSGHALGFPCGLDLVATGDFVLMSLLLSPLSEVTWDTPALRSVCTFEPRDLE